MQKVIFDSSFLIAVSKNPTTWFEDIVERLGKFKPVLLECVRDELKLLASEEGKRGRFARVSLEMASKFDEIRCGDGKVDDEIASAAMTHSAIVATTDAKLLAWLRASHVRAITLRKGRVSVD